MTKHRILILFNFIGSILREFEHNLKKKSAFKIIIEISKKNSETKIPLLFVFSLKIKTITAHILQNLYYQPKFQYSDFYSILDKFQSKTILQVPHHAPLLYRYLQRH